MYAVFVLPNRSMYNDRAQNPVDQTFVYEEESHAQTGIYQINTIQTAAAHFL